MWLNFYVSSTSTIWTFTSPTVKSCPFLSSWTAAFLCGLTQDPQNWMEGPQLTARGSPLMYLMKSFKQLMLFMVNFMTIRHSERTMYVLCFQQMHFSYYTIWKKYWFCSNVIVRIKFIYKTFRKQRPTSKCKEQTFALPIYIKICRNFQSIQSTYKFL